MLPRVEAAAFAAGYTELRYEAVESDATLIAAAAEELISLGFAEEAPGGGVPTRPSLATPGGTLSLLRSAQSLHLAGRGLRGLEIHISLIPLDARALADARDAASPGERGPAPQLVVACAFADLLSPDEMLALLTRVAPGALAYLPITFAGDTWLEPVSRGHAQIPADARVTEAYHARLLAQGQHLQPAELIAAAESAGAATLACGEAIWRIPASSELHPYMLDFLSAGSAPALWAGGWDVGGWRALVNSRRASICARNLDLLLRLPAAPIARAAPGYDSLQFVAPRTVEIVESKVACGSLAPGALEMEGITSMISSGTELLMYRGDFDQSDESLDAAIKGMGETIGYPMSYGYSWVGKVVGAGSGVTLSWVGRTAFAFAPHASSAFVDESSAIAVPEDISAADAAFLPAAETAVSIVHDAHPRAGELVAVFGAGVIGLLVVAQLRQMGLRVVAVDPDEGRRRKARELGASAVAQPTEAPKRAFDISIECSGNPRALQGAVDATRDHGTVVLASWYGAKQVDLQLGTRFHRSHLKLVASQVSTIPGTSAERWSKARRFGAAWDLIREVNPAVSILTETIPLKRASDAYDLLDKGKALVCHLSYGGVA